MPPTVAATVVPATMRAISNRDEQKTSQLYRRRQKGRGRQMAEWALEALRVHCKARLDERRILEREAE